MKRAPVWTRLFYNTSTETHSFVKLSCYITHWFLNVTLKTKRPTSHIARLGNNGTQLNIIMESYAKYLDNEVELISYKRSLTFFYGYTYNKYLALFVTGWFHNNTTDMIAVLKKILKIPTSNSEPLMVSKNCPGVTVLWLN